MERHVQEKQRAHFFSVFARLLLVLTSLAGAFFFLFILLIKAMQQEGLRDRIRRFNREKLNPVVLRLTGNGSRIYAAIEHTGRRSGSRYFTPVVARPWGDGFLIPLPYGDETDWCRNVKSAGKCRLHWKEQTYLLEKPEVLSLAQVLSAFPFTQRLLIAIGGVKYLWLHKRQEVAEEPLSALDDLKSTVSAR